MDGSDADRSTDRPELLSPMDEAPDPEVEDALTASVLGKLGAAGFLPEPHTEFDPAAYRALDDRVRAAFEVPHTTMTSLTRRVLFGLAAAHQPSTVLVLGCFVGYAAVWVFGPALPPAPLYPAARLTACDVFPPAVDGARANFAALGAGAAVDVVLSDAADLLAGLDGSIDMLFLDVDSPDEGKRAYAPLLAAARPLLAPGALVLAHDVTHPYYLDDVAPYRAMTRDKTLFRRTALLELDPCGLEVTLA